MQQTCSSTPSQDGAFLVFVFLFFKHSTGLSSYKWRVRRGPLIVHPPQKKQEDAATDVGLALPLHKRSLRTEQTSVMNPEEQTVTWLISMGALNSPKMMVEDPVQFLKESLKDGVALCKLLLRLLPGSIEKVCPG